MLYSNRQLVKEDITDTTGTHCVAPRPWQHCRNVLCVHLRANIFHHLTKVFASLMGEK